MSQPFHPPIREPTREELLATAERIRARVDRLNRVGYLAGQLSAVELEGVIVFLEAALRDRRALVALAPATAAEGLAYMLPDGVF